MLRPSQSFISRLVVTSALVFATNECCARDGAPRTSDFTPTINPIFAFNGPRPKSIPAPDCKGDEEAQQEFEKAKNKVQNLQWPESNSFLEKAYSGTLGFAGRIANVDHIAVVAEGDDRFRVYLGSDKIIAGTRVYCGFDQPSYLNKEWAEAGFRNQTLYEQLPEYTDWEQTVMKLSDAFQGVDYKRVRASLLSRGFRPIELRANAIDRCAPGLEAICQNYAEVACGIEYGKAQCQFEWASSDNQQIEISTSVTELPDNENQISITRVESPPPKQDPEEPQPAKDGSPADMQSWRGSVMDAVRRKVAASPHPYKGSHIVLFYVTVDGQVGYGHTPGQEGGDSDLANDAVRIVDSVGQVSPPPDHRTASFSMTLNFD